MRMGTVRAIGMTALAAVACGSASSQTATDDNQVLEIAERLEGSIVTLDELKEKLVHRRVCGEPERSERNLCAVAVYILYRDDGARTPDTMLRPIRGFDTATEIAPGRVIGDSSIVPQRVRPSSVRYVRVPTMGVWSKVPIEHLLQNYRGKSRDGAIEGWYKFAGVIGRRENQSDEFGLPQTVFLSSTYGG